jgi:hypothetical protein
METTKGIIKNLDTFKGIEPLTKNDMCLYRVRAMERAYGLTAEAGTIICWSNLINKWVFSYDWHYWCVDENGNLYDSFNALNTMPDLITHAKFRRPKNFTYLMINANDFNGFNINDSPGHSTIEKWANKYIPKSKYDFIYVYGLGWEVDSKSILNEDDLYNQLYDDTIYSLECKRNTEMTEKIIQNILMESK